jgi:hypothetical protein
MRKQNNDGAGILQPATSPKMALTGTDLQRKLRPGQGVVGVEVSAGQSLAEFAIQHPCLAGQHGESCTTAFSSQAPNGHAGSSPVLGSSALSCPKDMGQRMLRLRRADDSFFENSTISVQSASEKTASPAEAVLLAFQDVCRIGVCKRQARQTKKVVREFMEWLCPSDWGQIGADAISLLGATRQKEPTKQLLAPDTPGPK